LIDTIHTRTNAGRVEPLRVMIEEGIKKRRSLPHLRSLSLRNSGGYIYEWTLCV
jgi:hypothetical protein